MFTSRPSTLQSIDRNVSQPSLRRIVTPIRSWAGIERAEAMLTASIVASFGVNSES
jgi:hypothetical protein